MATDTQGEARMREIFCANLNRLFAGSDKQKKELAAFVGVSYNTVTSWVKGRKVPRMDKIDMICDFFNVNRSDIIVKKSQSPLTQQPVLSTNEIELVNKYRALDERGKENVIALIEREYGFIQPKQPPAKTKKPPE